MNTKNIRTILMSMTAAAGLAGGCNSTPEPSEPGMQAAETFMTDRQTSAVLVLADKQAASGARTDATLRAYHFDAGELNSLGHEKLGQMLKDDNSIDTFTVYLESSETDATTPPRREAIVKRLVALGLPEDSIKVEAGMNPDNFSPAAKYLQPAGPSAPAAKPSSGMAAEKPQSAGK